ncbi:hypothetical protein MNB_SM-5-429 [hydrothermal vent metagenome]|uniref:NrS-1 polymerase-like helicase domain-containing protein n=1 Tax=hydrothermal vent metagenome TaxID=652676 RepID=A0A1W1C466_9ZZZZ
MQEEIEILHTKIDKLYRVKNIVPSAKEEIKKLQKELFVLQQKIEEKNRNIFSIEDLLEELDKNLQFNGKYLFLDSELGKYVKIDMFHKTIFRDEYGNEEIYHQKLVDYIDKSAINGAIKNMIKNLQESGKLDASIDRHDTKLIKTIVSRIETISQKFSRHEKQIYVANDMTVLNGFVRTPLIEYIPETKISYSELRQLLSTKFPRAEIVFKNNFLNNETYIQYVLNWISCEMNVPNKVKTAIVLIGEQGSSKSLLTETIFRENLYDKSNVSIMSNSVWTDKFNSVFEGKTFLINNEISLSDRKETNDISELIKRLITDDTVFIRGMRKENIEKEVTFSQWFLSNKNEPVKIEYGDRRFSVFGRAKPLKENPDLVQFLEENNEDMDRFIANVKKEIGEFLYCVKQLEFDVSVCKTPLETEYKDKIIAKTNTKLDLIKSSFNTHNWEVFKNLLQSYEMQEDFIDRVEKMFVVGIFTHDTLHEIYTTFFHNTKNTISLIESGKWWNNILINISNTISVNAEEYRLKVYNDIFIDKKIEILQLILKNEDATIALKELESLELKGYIDIELDEDGEVIPFL